MIQITKITLHTHFSTILVSLLSWDKINAHFIERQAPDWFSKDIFGSNNCKFVWMADKKLANFTVCTNWKPVTCPYYVTSLRIGLPGGKMLAAWIYYFSDILEGTLQHLQPMIIWSINMWRNSIFQILGCQELRMIDFSFPPSSSGKKGK